MGGEEKPDGTGLELDLSRKHAGASRVGAGAEPASAGRSAPGRVAGMYNPEPVVDKIEARLLGKYPQPPSRFWELPGYARAVKTRLAELGALSAERAAKHAAAKAQLDQALVTIARRAVTLCQGLSRPARQPYAPTLDKITSQEAHLRSVDGAHMGEVDAISKKMAALDERLEPAKRELEAAKQEERRAVTGPGGKAASPAEAKALEVARTKVADAQSSVAILLDERAKLESEAKAVASASNPATVAAREEYNVVCADFAQFAMDDKVNFGAEFTADRAAVASLRDVAARAEKDAALYRAAAVSYDFDIVAKGRSVLIGTIVAATVLFLLVVVLLVK